MVFIYQSLLAQEEYGPTTRKPCLELVLRPVHQQVLDLLSLSLRFLQTLVN